MKEERRKNVSALKKYKKEDIRYLNIDLLKKSREDLTPVVENFGEDVFVLSNDKTGDFYYAYLEIAGNHAGPNEKPECYKQTV